MQGKSNGAQMQSMTGYTSRTGSAGAFRWSWELRSVNAKGLDLRMRIPEWIEGLEQHLRSAIGKSVKRGNVSLTLRVLRDDASHHNVLNSVQAGLVLDAIAELERLAAEKNVALGPSRASDVLAIKGVFGAETEDEDTSPLRDALVADSHPLIADFVAMRQSEGTALRQIFSGQIEEIRTLVAQAQRVAQDRQAELASHFSANVARILQEHDGIEPDRLAQELALLAVKTDVTEELHRLAAHVDAAQGLIDANEPVGRKLDFLMQEFNREANTLCSKSQHAALTEIGLALKVVIDQMREQVQNVE